MKFIWALYKTLGFKIEQDYWNLKISCAGAQMGMLMKMGFIMKLGFKMERDKSNLKMLCA